MTRLRDPKSSALKALQSDLRAIKDPFYPQVTNEGDTAAWDARQALDNPYPMGSHMAHYWERARLAEQPQAMSARNRRAASEPQR